MCDRCNNKDCAICANIEVTKRYTLEEINLALSNAKIHPLLKVRILKALRK